MTSLGDMMKFTEQQKTILESILQIMEAKKTKNVSLDDIYFTVHGTHGSRKGLSGSMRNLERKLGRTENVRIVPTEKTGRGHKTEYMICGNFKKFMESIN